MKSTENLIVHALSRRGVLQGAMLAASGGALAAAGLSGPAAAAQVKASQKAASYQPNPKGKQHCSNCTQWQAPAACKVVSGVIAPIGWCTLYALQR